MRRLCEAVLAAFLCGGVPACLCAQHPAGQSDAPAPPLPLVRNVRVVTSAGKVLENVTHDVTLAEGQPLDPEQVAASIRQLYRSGDFADIRAVSTPLEDGVQVDFVVQESLYFNQVLVLGLKAPPTDASASAAMQINLGEPFRQGLVDEGIERLKARLVEEGLYQAKVATELRPRPAAHEMDVIVHVDPGPRARVGIVHLTNNTEFSDAEIEQKFKLKPGKPLTNGKIQSGTSHVRKFLIARGHLTGRAAVRREEFNAAKNTVDLNLDISEGARVRLEVSGAKISGGDLKRLVPIYQEGAVDADLLEEGKRNIRERLERSGYFDSSVEYSTAMREVQDKKAHGQEEVITYRIELGDRHRLIGIDITGNQYFDKELLFSRLQIYKAAFGSRGRFSRRMIEADRQSMENLYRANGFPEATVAARIQDDYQQRKGDLKVGFVVSEGVQTRVADLRIEGNVAFTANELLGVIGSSPGQPYSDFNVATDRANILAMYFNEGFPNATFAYDVESDQPKSPETPTLPNSNADSRAEKKTAPVATPIVHLVYRITEGPQIHVRSVLFSGYKRTRLGVVRREVRVKPTEPLREGQVVDSQRRLYNLGIFNRVTIAPQNPNGTDTDKDIVVLVEEAKRYTIAYGGGFEVQRLASTTNPTGGEVQAAPRGIFEITKLNLTGRGDSLSLKLRGSTIEDRALLGYSVPDTFGNSHLSLQATAYTEKTQDINTFTEERYEGSVQVTDQLSKLTTLLYRYTFRRIVVTNLNIPPQEIPLFQAPTLVSQFGISWIRDTRDNPADASKGWFNTADFAIADTRIGSSASFLRFVYQNSSYHPIRRRFSFARSVRIGILDPYGDTVSLTFPAPIQPPLPRVIPLPERFFAGGGTSLRGFALNQAGPRDALTGFPVGGQAMLIFNQEFRFPMHLPYVGSRLGGTLFYDGGNVFSKLDRVTLRWMSPKPIFNPSNPLECQYNCTNELNYFSHTVGFGVRYATPVGPIRVDLGYQVNRPRFVIPIPCPSNTTISTCPTGSLGYESTQLPRLQVFFSLGSSF